MPGPYGAPGLMRFQINLNLWFLCVFTGDNLISLIQNIKRKQKTHLKIEKPIKHECLQNQ